MQQSKHNPMKLMLTLRKKNTSTFRKRSKSCRLACKLKGGQTMGTPPSNFRERGVPDDIEAGSGQHAASHIKIPLPALLRLGGGG